MRRRDHFLSVTAIAVAPDSKRSVETRSAAAGEIVMATSTWADPRGSPATLLERFVESLRSRRGATRLAEEALDLLKEALGQRAPVPVFQFCVGFQQLTLLHGEPGGHLDHDPDDEVAAAMATQAWHSLPT